ncbi:MAG: hypothetical protein LUB83_02400 [Prevotellaceae bacterium]|nr:hypothetical protein [Prevotellaceae bacterium]
MLSGDAPSSPDTQPTTRIRYYPEVTGTLGGVEFLANPNERWQYIDIPGYTDCTVAVNAHGDSMHPLIRSGQILLMTEWRESFIEWGKIYLVVTVNGHRCVKFLFPAENPGAVTCRSVDQAANPDFTVERKDIKTLYIVKGWICRDTM